MYEIIPTKHMERSEWLCLRKTGLGGSDAGAVCGLNPYSSAMKVFQDKTTENDEEMDSEAMRQGRDLENYVASRFSEATGLRVRRSNQMYRSKEHPFMIADVDRLIVGEDAGLECKTANAYNTDKWKDGEIPAHYAVQCYHYMAVTGRKSWYIAVVLLGVGFQYTKLTWDDEIIQNLIQLEKRFWQEHVEKRIMPEPDGSTACDAVLEQYFHTARRNSTVPLIGFDGKLERRQELDGLIQKLELEKRQIDQEVKLAMGENETAVSARFRVSWTNVNTSRLDAKRMKMELPEVYRDFCVLNSSRRFMVKAA